MTQGLSVLIEVLPKYIVDVKSRHSENSKAISFSSFIQESFNIPIEDLDYEVPVKSTARKLRGRVDAVFGNLIIEFKTDLQIGTEDAEAKLSKYLQAYHEIYPNVRHLGIANDGIKFRVYLPIFKNGTLVSLDLIDTIDIEKASAEDVFLWFDSYLFTSYKIAPTSKDLRKRFGLESPTFATFHKQLLELYMKVENLKDIQIKYNNWQRFLEIIYGDKPNELTLFLKHTYLSTFAKLLIHLRVFKGKPIKKENVSQIIYGDKFREAGIVQLFEEDFFVWIFSPSLRKDSLELIYRLLQQLLIYDLEKIDEDVLKELYQELVDPEQRKLLGEFYTPDWLAENIVHDVLSDDPELSVIDPACGSGTFLFKTIQYKIAALSKKGIDKSRILEHILERVIGFDVHPLAVTISKANYLLSLRDLLASETRKGPITIPVYLSDTLKIPQIKDPDLQKQIPYVEFESIGNRKFLFPLSVVSDFAKMDAVIDKIRLHAHEYHSKRQLMYTLQTDPTKPIKTDNLYNNLLSAFEHTISNIVNNDEKPLIVENLKIIFDLINNDSNSIWAYILRNMYKPIAITHKKTDVLIGNPPWSTLQFMKDRNYQLYLKKKESIL